MPKNCKYDWHDRIVTSPSCCMSALPVHSKVAVVTWLVTSPQQLSNKGTALHLNAAWESSGLLRGCSHTASPACVLSPRPVTKMVLTIRSVLCHQASRGSGSHLHEPTNWWPTRALSLSNSLVRSKTACSPIEKLDSRRTTAHTAQRFANAYRNILVWSDYCTAWF